MNGFTKHLLWMVALGMAVALLPTTPASAQEKISWSGTYQIEKGKRQGWLILKVKIPEGSHIYALTQKGNPPPTKLKLKDSKDFKLMKGFTAKEKPKVIEKDPVFEQRVEKHTGKVTFLAPIEVTDGTDLQNVKFELKFHGQLCNDSGCVPLFNKPVEVKFAGFYEAPKKKPQGSGNKSGSGSK